MKRIEVLGNGQIWDVLGIDKDNPKLSFEDLFSGRALEKILYDFEAEYKKNHIYHKRGKSFFSEYLEAGRLRGTAVTKALLSKKPIKVKIAKYILEKLASNGVKGIIVLNNGSGYKNWNKKESGYWRDIDNVIIGGGVSKNYTGKIIVNTIRKGLNKIGYKKIKVFQARFPGKESGFLGAVVNVVEKFVKKNSSLVAVIGLDLGRDKIGAGFVSVDAKKGKILENKNKFLDSMIIDKTPGGANLKMFLDSKRDYSKNEIVLGNRIRKEILEKIVDLIKANIKIIQSQKINCFKYVGISIPGEVDKQGNIIGSTDYLPFLRLGDNFYFKKELENLFEKNGLKGFKAVIINDGIAAGISNIYFDKRVKGGKIIFLGVGSGLGGFAGRIK